MIKLERIGIRGNMLNLIARYLRNRPQFTDISGAHSQTQPNINPFSTPQGSNLGPLLFILFINDVFKLPLYGKLLLFADDTTVAYTESNITELKRKMQHDINLLTSWMAQNKLTMNEKKNKVHDYKKKQSRVECRFFVMDGKFRN